jgi:signal transduction histidine kinase/sensor domain CHASE-containing protein
MDMDIRQGLLNVQEGVSRGLQVEDVQDAFRTSFLRALSSLRAKLIVPYVLLTMVIAMVGVFIVTRLVTSSIRERFVNQLFEASRVAGDGVVRRERTHLEDLRLMAFMEGVPDQIKEADAEGLQSLLWPVALNNNIEAVTVVDLEGREILTLAEDVNSGQYIASQGGDFSDLSIVAKILNGQVDEDGDKFADVLKTTYGPYLFSSAPVRDSEGRLVGVLMAGTRLETLLSELKAQSLADLVVLDSDGKLIATTLVLPDEGTEPLEIDPDRVDPEGMSTTEELELYGREYQKVVAPLILRRREVGWMSVILPSNYIVSTMATSRNIFSLIFSLGTVATIVLGYLLAQSIARPILQLRAVSQAVAGGELEQSTNIQRADEIGELSNAFDTMTGRLKERTDEAARLYAETVQRNTELAEINERLQTTQAQLVQSEKLASVGQLTAGIVHDVKNPLAVIKGVAEELHEEIGLDPSTRGKLQSIRDNASRANTIVTDLLKFARQSTPELHRRDMRETIRSALRLTEYLTRKGNVEVETNLPDLPVRVTYDAQQIEQVLINLITNAVQAMPEGGKLRVSLKEFEDGVRIDVADTGHGIRKENLSRIFDPFFTTKPEGEGTGLGLSISFGIVSRHGGRINVDSKIGVGTMFSVILPEEPSAPEDEGIE